MSVRDSSELRMLDFFYPSNIHVGSGKISKSEYLGNVGLIIDLHREFMMLESGNSEAGNYLIG